MSNLPPDREFYVAATSIEEATTWLKSRLGEPTKSGKAGKRQWKLQFDYQGHVLPVLIIEEASPGFTSIWVDSPHTPWETDQDAAREAFAFFAREVRAIASGWSEDQDPDEWWSLDNEGERLISWA